MLRLGEPLRSRPPPERKEPPPSGRPVAVTLVNDRLVVPRGENLYTEYSPAPYREAATVRGIANKQNDCWAISVIQLVASMTELLDSKEDPVVAQLGRYLAGNAGATKLVREVRERSQEGQQGTTGMLDEAVVSLLTACKPLCDTLGASYDLITRMPTMKSVYYERNAYCNVNSHHNTQIKPERVVPPWLIHRRGEGNLQSQILIMQDKEGFADDYVCPECKGEGVLVSKLVVEFPLPPVLVMMLETGRYSASQDGHRDDEPEIVPDDTIWLDVPNGEVEYALFAVASPTDVEGVHFVCDVKAATRGGDTVWYRTNDSSPKEQLGDPNMTWRAARQLNKRKLRRSARFGLNNLRARLVAYRLVSFVPI